MCFGGSWRERDGRAEGSVARDAGRRCEVTDGDGVRERPGRWAAATAATGPHALALACRGLSVSTLPRLYLFHRCCASASLAVSHSLVSCLFSVRRPCPAPRPSAMRLTSRRGRSSATLTTVLEYSVVFFQRLHFDSACDSVFFFFSFSLSLDNFVSQSS